ncbi:hypothetical protein CR513_42263, partial [Mucuna pruriens]
MLFIWIEIGPKSMFCLAILGFPFTRSHYDPSLFLQRTPKGIMLLLAHYHLVGLTNSTLIDTLLEVNVKYKREEVKRIIRYLLGSSKRGNALISWKCKKQDSVPKSSTEAEYRAMFAACSEIIGLCDLLTELGFPQAQLTLLHANNT